MFIDFMGTYQFGFMDIFSLYWHSYLLKGPGITVCHTRSGQEDYTLRKSLLLMTTNL